MSTPSILWKKHIFHHTSPHISAMPGMVTLTLKTHREPWTAREDPLTRWPVHWFDPRHPNTYWGGFWTPKHLLRRLLGVPNTDPHQVFGGFWKIRVKSQPPGFILVVEKSQHVEQRQQNVAKEHSIIPWLLNLRILIMAYERIPI